MGSGPLPGAINPYGLGVACLLLVSLLRMEVLLSHLSPVDARNWDLICMEDLARYGGPPPQNGRSPTVQLSFAYSASAFQSDPLWDPISGLYLTDGPPVCTLEILLTLHQPLPLVPILPETGQKSAQLFDRLCLSDESPSLTLCLTVIFLP